MRGAGGAPAPDLAVRVSGLWKRFGRTVALRDLSFAAEGPRVFGVVGPDGAGKTTLLRILAGLNGYDRGAVSVLGIDPARAAPALKPLLGYVPQAFSMYPTLTVDENLSFVARCHRIPRREFARRRADLLELAKLGPFAGARAETLSGGMKQKLALCGALLARPPLLILDEPTTGIDVLARAEFWGTIREEARRALVIVSTNYLDEAERCDQILYLVDGHAVASGTPQEIRGATAVRVFSVVGVPRDQEDALVSELRTRAAAEHVEPRPHGLRVETRLDAVQLRSVLADIGLPAQSLQIDEVEADLGTALLALEKMGRAAGKGEAPMPTEARSA